VRRLPLHIVFMEQIIGPACSLVFENEPSEASVMQRPPRDTNAQLFGAASLSFSLLQGLGALAVVIVGYGWALQNMLEPPARAFAFCTLVVANLALILSNRSRNGSLLASMQRPNRTLWVVSAGTIALLGVVIYVPVLAELFRFAPPPINVLATVAGLGLVSAIWFEMVRWARTRALSR